MSFLKLLLSALFAYIVAAPLTHRISMDLGQTHWFNLWTYFYWALGTLIWFILLSIVGLLVAALIVLKNQ